MSATESAKPVAAPAPGAATQRRTFRHYSYRGVGLNDLVNMKQEDLMDMLSARIRRKMSRGLKPKEQKLIARLRNSKKDVNPDLGERPALVKTHLRSAVVLPEMVGCNVGIYNGKEFNNVEIKANMIGHYLGEFSISYRAVLHGRPGIGATHSSRFIPLR